MSGVDEIKSRFDNAEDVAPDPDLGAAQNPPPGAADQPPEFDTDGPERAGALLPLNDSGNGLRFALYCGGAAMYVPRVGWHCWDGKRWKLDPDNIAVRRHAQHLQHRIIEEIPHLQLDEYQIQQLGEEAEVRAAYDELIAIESKSRTAEQKEKLEKLSEKIEWIGKIKTYRSKMKSDHRSFAKSSGNKSKIDAMLVEAVTSLHKQVEDLDADPYTVNTLSGVLQFTVTRADPDSGCTDRVADVKLLEHSREMPIEGRNRPQYITKLIPVEFDPDAKCPRFDAFLERVQPDADMRKFLQRWFGLSMTALPIQKFLYCYGMGANGKSLLANLMRRMLGDYATMVKIESLTGKNRKSGSDATPDMMKLIGARAAITNEPEEGERLQEQKVKEMTGGDSMMVRALHSDFVEFTPYFKLTFTGNHKLDIRGTDDGIWRRPLLCPFDVQIPEGERDEKLGDTLFYEEASGILNWLVAGLIDYLERGLQEPNAVRMATEEYRKDSDPIGDFLANGCIIEGDDSWLPARDLIDACYFYQLENTAAAWTPSTLSRRLKERAGKFMHPRSGKTYTAHKRGTSGYMGISIESDLAARLKASSRDAKGMPVIGRDEQDPPT